MSEIKKLNGRIIDSSSLGEIVADTTFLGRELVVYKTKEGVYNGVSDGVLRQPGHDADGIIRWLANAMMNAKS